jgi:hypothetical protein
MRHWRLEGIGSIEIPIGCCARTRLNAQHVMKRLLLRTPKQLRVKLKLTAFFISFAGVLLFWLNLLGLFQSAEKQAFAKLVMNNQAFLPRETPGFDAFLKRFPPPAEFSADNVSGIADKELRVSSPSDVGTTVRYVVNEKWTPAVARFDQVREWADQTMYDLLSGVLVTVGILVLLPIEIYEYRQGRSKKA